MQKKTSRVSRKEYTVLSGHKKKGTKFSCLPPNTEGVSYQQYGVPELAWIAVLIDHIGFDGSATVALLIGRALRLEQSEKAPNSIFASSFKAFTPNQRDLIVESLQNAELLVPTQEAVRRFSSLYPRFPGIWLLNGSVSEDDREYLPTFKSILNDLLDKTSVMSTCTIANFVYCCLVSGLFISLPNSFNNLHEISMYPNTEESQELASILRSVITMLIGEKMHEPEVISWSNYFWQRGFELEPVNYSAIWGSS